MAMRWTTAMSVGVPELDDDHKGLIHVINQLEENASGEARPAAVRQCLVSLVRYAETHFGREEGVMMVCDFPGIAAHREEHRAFIDKIRALADRFEDDPEGLADYAAKELVAFLQNWLKKHIKVEDKAYGPFAERRLAESRQAAQSFKAAEVWRSTV